MTSFHLPSTAPSPAPGPAGTGAFQSLLEDQRRALARELHDDIGGTLGAAHFDLAWVERHPGHPDAASHIASAHEALRQAMGAIQRVVHGLYPPDLSDGLVPALRALARGFERRFGIPVAFDVAPDFGDALPPPLRLAAYRTAQEALTNAARHARCATVAIASGGDAASAWLEVRDDGLGFVPGGAASAEAREEGGFGLRGLAERARDAGGRFEIDSRPGHGTTARLRVPLGRPAGDGDAPRKRQGRPG